MVCCCREMVSGRGVVGAIGSLMDAGGLQVECARLMRGVGPI